MIGANTDALFVSKEQHKKLSSFATSNSDLFETKDPYDSIGKWKLEEKACPRNLVEIHNNSESFGNIDFTIPKLKRKCFDIEKEWKDPEKYKEFLEQVKDYLSKNNRVLIRALSPGCGKTTLCTDIAKGKNYIIITPYNMMRSKLSQAGHTAMTLNKLLAYGKDERHKGTPINLKEYDIIIFDEVYLHDRKARTRIARLMDKEQHLNW